MNPKIRLLLSLILGAMVGMVVNMGIITVWMTNTEFPENFNPYDEASMSTLSAIDYLLPFLAHALGTLAGAIVASLIAKERKMMMALIIGVFFLIGGIANNFMLAQPTWFETTDAVLAYIPFALLGGMLTRKKRK